MTKLYLFSKSIHRILVLIIIVSTLIMSTTGIMLKYSSLANFFKIDLGLVRYIHSNLSVLFSITLVFMTLTGIVMYLYPVIRNKS